MGLGDEKRTHRETHEYKREDGPAAGRRLVQSGFGKDVAARRWKGVLPPRADFSSEKWRMGCIRRNCAGTAITAPRGPIAGTWLYPDSSSWRTQALRSPSPRKGCCPRAHSTKWPDTSLTNGAGGQFRSRLLRNATET